MSDGVGVWLTKTRASGRGVDNVRGLFAGSGYEGSGLVEGVRAWMGEGRGEGVA